jgi:hypothetical protein
MTQVSAEKDPAMFRISRIVEQLMQNNSLFQRELDRNRVMQIFDDVLENIALEEILSLEEEKLIKRVDALMATELLYGMLDDLTPEQMAMFDAAVEGR